VPALLPADLRPRLAALAVAVALLAACSRHPVGPARTSGAYEAKAVTTAESARSSVETVRLASEAGDDHDGFGPYLSVLVSGREDALAGVQDTFRSIQSPDEGGDALGDELDGLLGSALSHVTEVRTALRRGQLAGLRDVAAPLVDDSAALERFVEDHG
jgi:hypothetical protein